MSLLIPAAIALLTIPLVVALARANELFVLEVRGGRVRRVRGKLPPALFDDIAGVIESGGVTEARVRAVVEDGRPRIAIEGDEVPAPLRQRLRNTISLWPLAKIRAGRR